MTKKDYIFIARMIKYNTCNIEIGKPNATRKVYKRALILDLCNLFKDDNKLFDKDRFIKACE